jgi:hypothetical protein
MLPIGTRQANSTGCHPEPIRSSDRSPFGCAQGQRAKSSCERSEEAHGNSAKGLRISCQRSTEILRCAQNDSAGLDVTCPMNISATRRILHVPLPGFHSAF